MISRDFWRQLSGFFTLWPWSSSTAGGDACAKARSTSVDLQTCGGQELKTMLRLVFPDAVFDG